MQVLLVGGLGAGRFIEVRDLVEKLVFPVLQKVESFYRTDPIISDVFNVPANMDVDVYLLERLYFGDDRSKVACFYRHSSILREDVLTELLSGYSICHRH